MSVKHNFVDFLRLTSRFTEFQTLHVIKYESDSFDSYHLFAQTFDYLSPNPSCFCCINYPLTSFTFITGRWMARVFRSRPDAVFLPVGSLDFQQLVAGKIPKVVEVWHRPCPSKRIP